MSRGGDAEPALPLAPSRPAEPLQAAFVLLFVLWGGGAALGLFRFMQGLREVALLRRESRLLDAGALSDLLPHVQATLGVRRLPPVAVSDRVSMLVVVGFRNPIVLLPEGLAERLDREQLRCALIHECTHVALGHPFGGAAQRRAELL
jgi:beta-lactamase regulating signal transducer with metallopeptidase domain